MRYRNYYKSRSERGRRMALRRWEMDRQRRDAEQPERERETAMVEAENYPLHPGDVLGSLQWHNHATGKVRRWTVRIGTRRGQITVETPDGRRSASMGWTRFLNALRGYLAGTKI